MVNDNDENAVVEDSEKDDQPSAQAPGSPPASASAPAPEDEGLSSRWRNDEVSVANSTQVEGGSGPKGFGLKRWRRIKRDSTNDKDKNKDKDTDPIIRLLKRSSSPTNLIHPTHAPNNHADAAEASVSSTNANAFPPIFNPGPADSDNSDDRSSSKSSTAASAPKLKHRSKSQTHFKGKTKPNIVVDSSKKHQSHAPSFQYDNNPFSSVEPSFSQQSRTEFSGSNIANANCGNHMEDGVDPLANSIDMLRSAQISLEREVERFKELGKEIHLLCDDPNAKNHSFDGWAPQSNHTNVETLKTRLNEAEPKLKEKETKIFELEKKLKNMISTQIEQQKRSQDMETELDIILRGKIEAEIEHLLITRCTKDLGVFIEGQMKQMRDQKGMAKEEIGSSNLENDDVFEGGENLVNIRKKVARYGRWFGMQLSLLVLVIAIFVSRFTPKSTVVVPT